MDFQNRAGGKTGGGGVASASDANRDRRERLRQLALETIDIAKDPYFMKNHLGSYECKLCLTLHNNEGSYLAHTQGKKHQSNLARRAAKEALDAPAQPAPEKVIGLYFFFFFFFLFLLFLLLLLFLIFFLLFFSSRSSSSSFFFFSFFFFFFFCFLLFF